MAIDSIEEQRNEIHRYNEYFLGKIEDWLKNFDYDCPIDTTMSGIIMGCFSYIAVPIEQEINNIRKKGITSFNGKFIGELAVKGLREMTNRMEAANK